MGLMMNEGAAKQTPDTLEIKDIMRLLPHRYPFLMVDRIIEMDGDRSAIGIKTLRRTSRIFRVISLAIP